MDQQIKEENKIQNYCLNEISKVLATLKSKKLKTIKELLSNLPSLIQPYKLSMIEPSKQTVLNNDDVRCQPFVYTSVNDRLNFNSDDKLVESPRPSDVCINFPVAEITYTADLSESCSNFMDNDDRKLYEMHGRLFPIRILIGDKLFINGLELVNSKQIGIFYSYLTWARDSAKNKKETPFNNLAAAQNFFPKIIIITTNGINLDTHEKLTDWMNNLYQDDTDIISNNNLVHLKIDTTSFADKKQPGVDNFKEELTLENWVKYSKYVRWVKEFRLFQGLIIDQNFELKICKEKAIDLIDFPNVESSDKFYLEMVKPTTILEEILINNNIFSANNNSDISSFPFIKVSDDPSYQDNVYFLVKCERYKISLSKDNIKPSEKLKKDIDKALESMTPLICLQKIFDKYGWFISLNISLGKSLKNIIGNLSNISKKIDFALPVFESLAPHLTDYGINCLITQKGEIIEENDLPEWIQNADDDLEVIELNNIIPLYNILEVGQTKRIDTVLNEQDKVKIIMTGSVDLKDLDITEQIIINIEPSLDNKNYEVFGSIASKNNSKFDDIFVTFGSYEINEFSATIVTSKNTHISIEECYIIWMIIGNPSELSVFYPNNREVQVGYFKSAITLQRNNPSYSIKTSHQLSQGYDIFIKCFEPINIELTGWSKDCVYLNISNSSIDFNLTQSNVEVAVCTLSRSNCENSKIDINGIGYSMGYILNENNYREPQLEQTNTQNYLDKQYPIKGDRTNLNELKMTNENLKGHLDLSDFINLEKLDCSNNELTSIDISRYNLKAWKKNWKLIKENETLQNQIKRIEKLTLDAKFIKLKDENNDLHEKEEKLMKKNNQLGQKLTKLERETNNLKQMVRELNARLKQQYDVHTQTEQQIKEKEKKLGSLIAEKLVEKEELEKEIKALKDDLAANKKDIIESEKLLEEKNKELNIKENKTTVLEKKRDKIKSSLSEIEAKKDELGDLKKKLKYEGFFSKASTSELRKKMDDLEKDLKSSQSKKEKLEAEAETIENELEEIRKHKEDLQNEQIEQQAHVETLRKDGKSLQDNLEGKKSSLKEKEEIISDLQQQSEKKIAALNNEIKNKEENLREKEKFICNIQQQSEKKLKEKEELINELKQQNEKRIAALSNEIKNKEENLREKEKFICNIQQQSEKKLKEKEELINELKQQNEKKITALNNDIKNKEEHIDKLSEETKKCQNFQENFKKKIGDLLSQIQTQQTELSELVNKIDKEYDLGRKGKSLVDNILEQQRNIILTNGDSVSEELGTIKGKLNDVYELTEEKVRDILDKQAEKTKLEMQLKSLINQE
ncbi:hypothetical protein RhiirC2_813927 [Rhizophagus irregularis]|uniref:Uncharacterized protein n=1 Tax=Rhizophagus irregularis TaxID=588596 RepID=A0A2N1NRH5_9GLOM|nr:hypothetical protein RhiirC2_816006 [Rhizophagus irregularis]PKK76505.1 hypothetical protein RhiirC2_813927 [Rhizophagus irregularis]